jgi:hypothetical protein
VAAACAKGTPLPISFAAALAGVTKQRIWMLIDEGTLTHVSWEGWNFVTFESVWRWRMGTAVPAKFQIGSGQQTANGPRRAKSGRHDDVADARKTL